MAKKRRRVRKGWKRGPLLAADASQEKIEHRGEVYYLDRAKAAVEQLQPLSAEHADPAVRQEAGELIAEVMALLDETPEGERMSSKTIARVAELTRQARRLCRRSDDSRTD